MRYNKAKIYLILCEQLTSYRRVGGASYSLQVRWEMRGTSANLTPLSTSGCCPCWTLSHVQTYTRLGDFQL